MIERDEALKCCAEMARQAGAALFVGNGNNARATAALCDSENVFYMLGSMGLCSPLAAGYSRSSGRPTIVIEGDGNALMGLSAMPAVSRCAECCFVHVVLDNGTYETTGAQMTLSDAVSFPTLACCTSYARARTVASLAELEDEIRNALSQSRGPTFVYVPTNSVTGPQHPRVSFHPRQIRERFEE